MMDVEIRRWGAHLQVVRLNKKTVNMNLFRWWTGRFSSRGKALALYRRGMSRANKHDHQGAIDDYSTTIGMADVPNDVRAMALYNRALVYAAAGQGLKATEDLNLVLAMTDSLIDVKSEARRKLVRMQRRTNDSNH